MKGTRYRLPVPPGSAGRWPQSPHQTAPAVGAGPRRTGLCAASQATACVGPGVHSRPRAHVGLPQAPAAGQERAP